MTHFFNMGREGRKVNKEGDRGETLKERQRDTERQ